MAALEPSPRALIGARDIELTSIRRKVACMMLLVLLSNALLVSLSAACSHLGIYLVKVPNLYSPCVRSEGDFNPLFPLCI